MASRTSATFPPPVMEARRWIDGVTFPPDRPLINVSQAAPVAAPPQALRDAMAEMVLTDTGAHLYGPVLGLPELREELAGHSSAVYGGTVRAGQVAITAGCNQAFTAAISALAGEGDAVMLPLPWYFNHAMWLQMAGVRPVGLPTGADMLPDPDAAARMLTPRTRAIALVSPNNPAGVEYPAELIAAFAELARARGITLIIDETYRDFRTSPDRPHDLFEAADWDAHVVHLYSFSKAYRLTGHRVGAMVAAPALLSEAEKFLDTVAICPPQLGQRAALWGLRHLDDWLAGERLEVLRRLDAIRAGLAGLEGWRLKGSGAYFAYVEAPFDLPSGELAPALVRAAGLLALPGSMFRPAADAAENRELRIAFANIDSGGIAELIDRLAGLDAASLAGSAPSAY